MLQSSTSAAIETNLASVPIGCVARGGRKGLQCQGSCAQRLSATVFNQLLARDALTEYAERGRVQEVTRTASCVHSRGVTGRTSRSMSLALSSSVKWLKDNSQVESGKEWQIVGFFVELHSIFSFVLRRFQIW